MQQFPAIWVEGERASALPLPDRGLDFGDGLFETLLLRRGRPLLLDYHWQRLLAGIERLGFPDCRSRVYEQLLAACAQLGDIPWAALRLTLTRGAGPRGYAPPPSSTPRLVISAAPLEQDRSLFPVAIQLEWADIRWAAQPALAGIKHLNRLEQVIAAGETRAKGCDEVVVLNQDGSVCSVSSGNLFALIGGELLTPPLVVSGIAGTRRRLILEQLAPALGLVSREQVLQPDDLMLADEAFCCNSLRGLQPVARLHNRHWSDHPTCRALHGQYLDYLQC